MEEVSIPISHAVELLIKWEFSEEVQLAFINQNVELEEFLKMGLTRLQEFVPDDRERLRLIKKIMTYKRDQLASITSIDSKDSENKSGDERDKSGDDKDDSDFDPDVFLNSDKDQYSDDASDTGTAQPLRKQQKQTQRKDLPTAGDQPSTSNDRPAGDDQPSTSKDAQPSTNRVSSAVPNRLSGILAKNAFQSLNLKEYLKETNSRAEVFVGNKNGILTKSNRKLLINILAEFILEKTYSPTIQDFLIVRDKIPEVFPNENKLLYYAAPKEKSSQQTLASGKLYDRVRNKISRLINKGVIQPRRKRKSSVLESSSDTEENQVDEASAEISAALVILKRSRQITPDIEEKWSSTSEFRLNLLYRSAADTRNQAKKSRNSKENSESVDLVSDYFKDYKILNQPLGYKLLLLDFKIRFPQQHENLLTNWEAFSQKLQKVALSLNRVDDPIGKELWNKLKSINNKETASTTNDSDDNQLDENPLDDNLPVDENGLDALMLMLLPSLCPPTARVKLGKKTVKPSIIESRDAFICHTVVAADLEPLIERRRDRMTKLNAPLQPFLILLGPQRWNISASYVAFDRVLYKFDSVLDALDACFKVFHSVCGSYPAEANHLWHIFHHYVYLIEHNPVIDGQIPNSTSDFIATLKSI